MSYLKFDKTLLINLEKSLAKEMLRTNKSGAYSATTIIDCNTRKYHGLLVVPLPQFNDDHHVLLSSFDETVIQHGAEFNMGIHKYQEDYYSPKGHKYIREFDIEKVARTIYRVGGVILSKERVFISHENRILIKYTLLEAHSPTLLRFRPFLAFRNVNTLSSENDNINRSYQEIENGIATSLYDNFPLLHMQFSKKPEYVFMPDWYKGIEYMKEQERGYDFKEDLYVPGYFELPIKKGESIIFSAGVSDIQPTKLKKMYDDELNKRTLRLDFFYCLKNAAQQFYNKKGSGDYLIAGYPWFHYRARDEFVSLPASIIAFDNVSLFESIMKTAQIAVHNFLNDEEPQTQLAEVDSPDALLWLVWAIQQYALFTSNEQAYDKYGELLTEVMMFILEKKHPRLFLQDNGLLSVNGREHPATWMNAVEYGYPITPRSGYVVEINALWYNALRFLEQLVAENVSQDEAEKWRAEALLAEGAFSKIFWNGNYLYDYVDGYDKNVEVRPNMIFAVSLPFSPLNKDRQKLVLDIITRELLTPKGLRSLSPKSGSYRPQYIGGQLERNRNYHNGPIWPWTLGAYAEAYLKIYKKSGIPFLERIMIGLENEMSELCIGTLPELFDGNPPYKGHGAMSFSMSVAEVLRTLQLLKKHKGEG